MYVTDTHALLHHSLVKKPLLGKDARRIFEKADAGETIVFVPTIVLWEVSSLVELGRIHFRPSFEHWCRTLDNHDGFSIVSLEWMDVREARHLPFPDPFDRLIAGTALRLDVPLITKDRTVVESDLIETVW